MCPDHRTSYQTQGLRRGRPFLGAGQPLNDDARPPAEAGGERGVRGSQRLQEEQARGKQTEVKRGNELNERSLVDRQLMGRS